MPLTITRTVTMSDDWLTKVDLPLRSIVTNDSYSIEAEDGTKVTFANPESVTYEYPDPV